LFSSIQIAAEQIAIQINKVISTIISAAGMDNDDVFITLAASGIKIPINGNNAKILNISNSFIGIGFELIKLTRIKVQVYFVKYK